MFRLRAQLLGKLRFIGSFRSVKAPYSLFLITESWNWRVFFLNCYLRVIWCTYNTENLTFSLPFAKTIWPSPGTIEFDLNTQRRFGLYADVLPCFLFFVFFNSCTWEYPTSWWMASSNAKKKINESNARVRNEFSSVDICLPENNSNFSKITDWLILFLVTKLNC